MQHNPIKVKALVDAPLSQVWNKWTNPQDVMEWNNASDDWHTPFARNDLRIGGKFLYRMESRDGQNGFDFSGVYREVVPEQSIAYTLDDGRSASVQFAVQGPAILVTEMFDPEKETPIELQRAGWQAILDNFKRHVEKTM
jgi:uncharacterized protein YndB with AHSA1/START domain